MAEVKRVQYFDHQFLRVDEFTEEQDYHRRMRAVHNATLHTPGISSGLDVTVVQGASHVRVSPGTGVDAKGRDIVLDEEFQLELGGLPANADAFVVISWQERTTDPATDGSGHDTRWTEAPKVEGMTSQPTDGERLVLARVTRQGTTVQPNPDVSGRRVAGVTAGDLALSTLRLRAPNIVATSWPAFTAVAAKVARLDGSLQLTANVQSNSLLATSGSLGSLTVTGPLAVDTGNANAGTTANGLMFGSASGEVIASTRVAGAPNRFGLDFYTNSAPRLSIDNAGRVGIGVRAPQVTLDVQGGEIRWGNNARLVNDQGGSIELGGFQGAPGVGVPYIDFHYAGLNEDFNTRIINDGNGFLSFIAGTVTVKGALAVETGNQRIRNMAPNDATQALTALSLIGRGAGGAERTWTLYTAAVAGGFGVESNAFEIWQYPETVPRLKIRPNGNTILCPSGGSVTIPGNIGTQGRDPVAGLPTGWGGGVQTFDVYAHATVAAGPAGGPARAWFNSNGDLAAARKNFIIDHPNDPKRELVHATLEGPEHAVIYRGEGELSEGVATVTLPGYFEGLTRVDGRTVLVTPRVAVGGRVATLGASEVRQGSFTVRAADDADASARFWWQVIAVRGDVDLLEVEPLKKGSRLPAPEEKPAKPARSAKRAKRPAKKRKPAAKRKSAPAKR